ncbi:MAG: hypothetical protein HY215_03660 [Candidatus Rokubacteria bacterium]|nr:hypothetical protein [Candidatus Rokubacteria bacterium]
MPHLPSHSLRPASGSDAGPASRGRRRQRRAGLGQSPRTILEELRRIQSTDVVLPTTDGRELRLRCVVRPDAAQAALLDRLGLDLPQRLRIPPPLAQTAQM